MNQRIPAQTKTEAAEKRRSSPVATLTPEEISISGSNQAGLRRLGTSAPVGAEPIAGVPPIVSAALETPGKPLDPIMRARLEPRLGRNLSSVQVHTDDRAAQAARAIEARAFTIGNHIVFGANEYAPGTAEGNRLIAHETAHTAQQARSARLLPGIAPAEAPSERNAEAFAAAYSQGAALRSPAFSPAASGAAPAYQLHAQTMRVIKKGKVEHAGAVHPPPKDVTSVSAENVEVRTGEEFELPGGKKYSNGIALEFAGLTSANSKWLQFVWFEALAILPNTVIALDSEVTVGGVSKKFTTDAKAPIWTVDSASTSNPFYESSTASLRTPTTTTIFDAPGGDSVKAVAEAMFKRLPDTFQVRFSAHLETYLVQNNVAAYVVPWVGSTIFVEQKGNVVGGWQSYNVGSAGPVNALPTNLRTALHTTYPAYKGVT